VLEVVVSAFLNPLYHEPFQLVKFTHHKGQVIAFHLRAYVLFYRINFHKEHSQELILTLQRIDNHRNNILKNEVLLIPKVINPIDRSPGQGRNKVVKIQILIIPTKTHLNQLEHFRQNPINLLNLLFLMLLFKHLILKPPRLYHRYFPHLYHRYSTLNQSNIFYCKLISLTTEKV
jgi:hypothetical protein